MAVYKRGRVWWYKFTWNGEPIRESTKQTNKRVAEQIEAAHKTRWPKAKSDIRDRAPIPTLKDFIEHDFTPFIESRFQDKPKTLEYYKNGIKNVTGVRALATSPLDKINTAKDLWRSLRSDEMPACRSPASTGNSRFCDGC